MKIKFKSYCKTGDKIHMTLLKLMIILIKTVHSYQCLIGYHTNVFVP